MNPQERELLTTFLQQMSQAQAGQKDAEADRLIREAVARQPDAAYLLVQRAMGLEYALQAAQDQLRSNTSSGFLDSPNSWGRTTPAAAQAPVQQVQAVAKPASSWGSGMLGTVATTAAGVVAGSFLFQGIQGLMGHHNAAANETPLPPVSRESRLDSDDVADALDDSTDSAALDGGDFDSGDTA